MSARTPHDRLRFRPHLCAFEDRLTPAVHEWTGQGANNLWSNAANWTGGSPATDASGDIDLVFHSNLTNAAQLVTQNDIAGLVIDSLTFDATALAGVAAGGLSSAGYTINGNAFTINTGGTQPGLLITAGVSNAPPAALTETINAPVNLATSAATFQNLDANARLVINGNVNTGGQALTIDSVNTLLTSGPTTAGVELNGVLGGGGSLTKTSAGSLLLSGANTYSGGSTFNGGTTVATNNSSLGAIAAATTVNNPARVLLRGGVTVQQAQLNNNSNAVGGGLGADGNTTNTFKGNVALSGAASTALGAGNGVAEANTRLIVDGVISGGGAGLTLSLNGAGVIEFTQANTYTGQTNLNGNNGFGALQIDNPAGLGAGGIGNETILNRNGAGPTGSALWLNFSGTLQSLASVGEIINFAGSGVNSAGAIRLLGNNTATIPGSVVFTAGAPWFIGVDTATATLTTTGVIDSQGANRALTKVGAGTLVVGGAAANTYLVGTVINGGVVRVTNTSANPLGPNANTVTVNATGTLRVETGVTVPNAVLLNTGGTLAGTGTVNSTVTSTGGTISPGASPGTLTVNNNVTLDAASTFRAEINGTTAGTQFDQLVVNGTVTLGGAALSGQLGFTPAVGNTFLLIANDGTDAVVGTFANLPEGATTQIGGFLFTVSYVGGTGNDVVLTAAGPALPPNLVVSGGPPNGSALVFAPGAGGQYATTPAATLTPFGATTSSVRTAVADVDGDGTPDTVLVTGPGGPVRVAVISGKDNSTVLVAPFDPFGDPNFTGGGFVAAANLDGAGGAEFVVTPDQGGGPRVTIFSLGTGGAATQRANFLGIDDPNFRGGARAALGDVNRDGTPDLAVSAGFLGGPRTALFNGTTVLGGTPVRLIGDFFAFPGTDATTLRNGVFVAAGDVDGDGFADLIFGGGPGGAPRVFVLSGALVAANNVAGAQSSPVANFFVAGNSNDRGGVRLATVDADGDGRADVAAGSGEGSPSKVRVYLGKNFTSSAEPATFQDLDPFSSAVLAGGVFVG